MKLITKFQSLFKREKYVISDNHFFKNPVTQIISPNYGDFFTFPLSPFYIVLHYTATVSGEHAIKLLTDSKIEASAHLVLDRDGKLTQLVPFNRVSWHSGKSEWKGLSSLNKCSIGIEIVNAGKLEFEDGRYLTWDKKFLPQEEVDTFVEESGNKTFWHKYTKKQLEVLDLIIPILKNKYKVSEILMHSEISPDRKIDPGPIFPISRYRD
jgi:N-acetylmuramoyl-L-alanine amidase